MQGLLVIGLLSCNICVCSLSAQDQFESIRTSIRAKMQQRNVPSIAVAVAQGGNVLWEQGFGWADREKRIPADANTMYSLASISKPLTATALMTLVAAGKIDLDKPINDYLGAAKLRAKVGNADGATVRRVANHSSGLSEHFQFFYQNESWRAPSMDDTILRFGNLVTAPGERFQYSNFGYGVIDHVISRISGRTFADYMRQEVFLKLGMTRSAVGNETSLVDFEATRYDGEDLTPIVYYNTDHPGASEIYSSAHDLALFGMFSLKAHLSNQSAILPDALIDSMQEPTIFSRPEVGYGIGWEKDATGGAIIVSHSGGMPGVATWLRLFPAQKLVIVVLCNEDDRLAHTIADEITEKLVRTWKRPVAAAQRPAFVPPQDLVGLWDGTVQTYRSTMPFHLEVLASGEIRVHLEDQLATILDHVSFEDGTLRGMFKGDINLPEAARRPYVVSVSFKLRDGHALNGAITVRADGNGTMPAYSVSLPGEAIPQTTRVEKDTFVLTQWAELYKQ
ncbi:MAG TPA: serine hydrolase domain-containing protein [Edaphobacter sp.]|nr:serine hydrolase domain-containing protein [Edaphobacter sp.]